MFCVLPLLMKHLQKNFSRNCFFLICLLQGYVSMISHVLHNFSKYIAHQFEIIYFKFIFWIFYYMNLILLPDWIWWIYSLFKIKMSDLMLVLILFYFYFYFFFIFFLYDILFYNVTWLQLFQLCQFSLFQAKRVNHSEDQRMF